MLRLARHQLLFHLAPCSTLRLLAFGQVPYFNAPIFLQNKTQIGKIEEIFGAINDGVSVLMNDLCVCLPARGHLQGPIRTGWQVLHYPYVVLQKC